MWVFNSLLGDGARRLDVLGPLSLGIFGGAPLLGDGARVLLGFLLGIVSWKRVVQHYPHRIIILTHALYHCKYSPTISYHPSITIIIINLGNQKSKSETPAYNEIF